MKGRSGKMDVKYGGCDFQNNNAAFVEGEEFYFNRRILCREPSGRRSSSVYYRRGEGVPFKWEKKPGTPNAKLDDGDPNNNNNNIIIPPLSPPPSLQSLGLSLPCFDNDAVAQQQSTHYVFSWRKIKKMLHAKIGKKKSGGSGLHQVDDDDNNFGVRDSDTEFIASLKNSNSLSSSSSSSFSNGSSFCYGSPWNMKAIMVCIAKRTYLSTYLFLLYLYHFLFPFLFEAIVLYVDQITVVYL